MRKILKTFIQLQFLVVSLFSFGVLVKSAGAASLEIAPINALVQLSGGEEKTLYYTLTNKTETDWLVSLQSKSFTVNQQGQPNFLAINQFPFLDLQSASEPASLLLPAQTSKDFLVVVQPPLGLAEKEYPLTLFFNLQAQNKEATKSDISLSLGSNLIVLLGESQVNNSWWHFAGFPLPKVIDSWWKKDIPLLIENRGPQSMLLQGKVSLLDKAGKNISEFSFYPDLILAQSMRQARLKQPTVVLDKINLSPLFGLPKFLLGEYRLSLELGSEQKEAGAPVIIEQKFFAFPYILLITLIFGWLIILLIRSLYKNKSRTKLVQKKWQKRLQLSKEQGNYFRQKD